jgi:uncharacterized protein YjbI with pentapeptide repeats
MIELFRQNLSLIIMLTRFQRLVCTICLGIFLFLSTPIPAWANAYDKQTLIAADFAGKDLRGSQFNQSNMRNSTFKGANLQGVSFFGTNLTNVDMTGADLTGAAIDNARFSKTNLTNAILVGAFATSTKFNGAIIEGADFTDVLLRQDVQKTLCATASGTNPTTGRKTRETLNCP